MQNKTKTKPEKNFRCKGHPFFLDSEEKKKREDNFKDVRNLFRLKKEINNKAFKDI